MKTPPELADPNEVVRVALILMGAVPTTASVLAVHDHQKRAMLGNGQTQYSVPYLVALQLIEQGWFTLLYHGTYSFNEERRSEWMKSETARTQRAQATLVSMYGEVIPLGYGLLKNTRSMDHDVRGYVFRDSEGNTHVVTAKGGVHHVPELFVIA